MGLLDSYSKRLRTSAIQSDVSSLNINVHCYGNVKRIIECYVCVIIAAM